jgi:outer membrane protein insertion porin family
VAAWSGAADAPAEIPAANVSRAWSLHPSWSHRIRTIAVYENTRTRTATVLAIAGIQEGSDFQPDALDLMRNKLLSSGLFQEVTIACVPQADGVDLFITARDKIAWFIAPTFAAASGNIGGGLIVGHSNLFGLNKQILFYGGIFTADSRSLLSYNDRSLFGTRLYGRLDLSLSRLKIDEFNPDSNNGQNLSNPQLFRQSPTWLGGVGLQLGIALPAHLHAHASYRLQAIHLEAACVTPDCANEALAPNTPLGGPGPHSQAAPDGTEAYLHLAFGYDSVLSLGPIHQGAALEGWYELGASAIGSDFAYSKVGVRARYAQRVFREHNLVLRSELRTGWNLPLTEEFEGGGPTTLRGFEFRQFRGDTSIDGHVEYSFPILLAWSAALRGVAFYDIQTIWFRDLDGLTLTSDGVYRQDRTDGTYRTFLPEVGPSGMPHAPVAGWGRQRLYDTVGGGLRVFLKTVAIPLVGVDAGYGLEAGGYQIYVAIGGLTD